jgi:type IX secretion system PorP/SprF family membrane protein
VLNFAHHFQLGGIGQLGVGVGVGISSLGINGDKWVPPVTLNDPSLPETFSQTKFDANFGLYFKANAGYYVGLSTTHIPGSDFEDGSTVPTGLSSARHYYLMGGHTISQIVNNDDLEMNLFVRTDLVKTSFDLNARYIWNKMLYGGLTYRMSDAVGIMVGANVFALMNGGSTPPPSQQLTVGYSYDISVNKLSNISTGSHEMFVKYCYFLPPVPISKSKHPRWL